MSSDPPTRALVAVYADESCLGNGREGSNPGGAAGLIQIFSSGQARPLERDYWLSEPATTNNRMALRSAIEAFRILSARKESQRSRVLFTSDSTYLVHGMTEWMAGWISRGWRRRTGTLENIALWQELHAAANAHEHSWRWVKGHAVHVQNSYADYLATRAARDQTSSSGAVESGFEAWLAAERARGRHPGDPDGAPDPSRFRPGCSARANIAPSLF